MPFRREEGSMGRKLATWLPGLVCLTTVAIVSTAAPASAGIDATTCTGQFREPQGARSAEIGGSTTRRPVAMVPRLSYDPRTMSPRGICRAGPGLSRI